MSYLVVLCTAVKGISGPVLGRQSCLEIGDFTVLSLRSDGGSDGLFLAL